MKTPPSPFTQTLEQEKNKFFRYDRKRLSRIPTMDMEDIVADMVHGLLKRADIFGEIENLTAYAYRALENRIIDFRRNIRPTESLDDDASADSRTFGLPSSADNPERSLERLQLQDRLLWAIGQLSPKERAVWIANEIDGLVTVHIVFELLLAGTLALVIGYVVMLLWNGLIPDILALPQVSYWQSVGMLLARILVGGFGHGRGRHSPHGRREGPQAWKDYDEWWKEVGERSFRRHSSEAAPEKQK